MTAPTGSAKELRDPAPGDVLPAREAYRLWAPGYARETVVSSLEERLVRDLTPTLSGRSLLDAGCGTGRRLPGPGTSPLRAVGVDLVPEMLTAGPGRRAAGGHLVAGDLRRLPLRAGLFDVVWCRLALGHVRELAGTYLELARVSAAEARLVVSDFHPDAVAAGHARTFRDPEGRVRAVEHHVHTPDDHRRAAEEAGWRILRVREAAAGPEERQFYARAGRLEQYERERGLPLVLALVMCLRP